MIKILVCGVSGRLGQVLCDNIAKTDEMVITAGVDKFPNSGKLFSVYTDIEDVIETVDVIIDFSRPDALCSIMEFAVKKKCAVVIATTGHTQEQKEIIYDYANMVPIFFAANMSLGVNLQIELIKKAAEFLGETFDIEIIEKHHNTKVDSPSGTALYLADELNHVFLGSKNFVHGRTPQSGKRETREIGIHAVRGGTVVGDHDVLFLGKDEILSVHHQALSTQVFATGAIRAAGYISNKVPGLYTMADMIAEANTVTRIFSDDKQAIINLQGVPYIPASTAEIFARLAKCGINVDIISQTSPIDGYISISFSIPFNFIDSTKGIIEEIKMKYPTLQYKVFDTVTKLTIEGMGMERQIGVAAKLFSSLASQNIEILIISTSETKIVLCIENQNTTKAIRIITKAFKL